MGPLLVLVSPCFRENVVVTGKIGSFLCSLENLLQKNVIVFFFENQISKWRSFEKRVIFDLLFTFFSLYQGLLQKLLQHISHSYTYMYFSHPIDFFCFTNFEKKIRIYKVRFLFSVIPGVDSYSRHFGTINKLNKMVSKFKLECLLLICIYTNAKFIVICKPRTKNDGDEDSVKYRNRKKHCFLVAAILLFIDKIIIS